MRPLPSPISGPSDRQSADLFAPSRGLEQEMDDATLLSLLMTRTMPELDVVPAAATLLAVFGSVAAVVAADPPELALAARLDATTITDLKMLRRLSVRIARSEACRRPVLSSWSALVAYVRSALAHEPREQFRTLYLDKKNILLRDEFRAEGTVDHAPVYNSGPDRVARLGRIPNIAETQAYVAAAVDCYLALSAGRGSRNSRECRAPETDR